MQRAPFSYRRIAAHLRRGGLIAYPTESCYGLGCDPDNRIAVQHLLKLKRRPQHKGLILVASHYHQVARYIQPLTHDEQARLQSDGAQAVTYLMPAKSSCPRWLRGAHDTLAVRLTAYRQAAQLCRGLNSALVSTSANRSGQRPAKTYAQCQRLFGRKVWVLPGRVGKRKNPSTIRSWADDKIIRS
ncbi:MAG: L-threonylcarbamoyladenylate synthase [Pseudomonadota bacterium]